MHHDERSAVQRCFDAFACRRTRVGQAVPVPARAPAPVQPGQARSAGRLLAGGGQSAPAQPAGPPPGASLWIHLSTAAVQLASALFVHTWQRQRRGTCKGGLGQSSMPAAARRAAPVPHPRLLWQRCAGPPAVAHLDAGEALGLAWPRRSPVAILPADHPMGLMQGDAGRRGRLLVALHRRPPLGLRSARPRHDALQAHAGVQVEVQQVHLQVGEWRQGAGRGRAQVSGAGGCRGRLGAQALPGWPPQRTSAPCCCANSTQSARWTMVRLVQSTTTARRGGGSPRSARSTRCRVLCCVGPAVTTSQPASC